jgi:hypothetical protein
MLDPSDIQLDRSSSNGELITRRSYGPRIAAVAVVVMGIAVIGYVMLRRAQTPAPAVRVETEQAVAARPETKSVAVPGLGIPIGPLDQTDGIVRTLVGQLSSHPTIAAWLATDQLVRHFTLALVNIGDGDTPYKPLRPIAPRQPFAARSGPSGLAITPESYRRYDPYADAFAALDARGAAQVYATLKPALQEAYDELGRPAGTVDAAMESAIVQLLKTPVVGENVAMEQKAVVYRFADPNLEALPAAQRQLLRMGPRNVKIVQAKLREIAPLIGIPPERLPPPAAR